VRVFCTLDTIPFWPSFQVVSRSSRPAGSPLLVHPPTGGHRFSAARPQLNLRQLPCNFSGISPTVRYEPDGSASSSRRYIVATFQSFRRSTDKSLSCCGVVLLALLILYPNFMATSMWSESMFAPLRTFTSMTSVKCRPWIKSDRSGCGCGHLESARFRGGLV
jgi:hypothetical protein